MWLFMRTSPEGLFLFHRPEFFKFFFPFGGAARVPSHFLHARKACMRAMWLTFIRHSLFLGR